MYISFQLCYQFVFKDYVIDKILILNKSKLSERKMTQNIFLSIKLKLLITQSNFRNFRSHHYLTTELKKLTKGKNCVVSINLGSKDNK